MRRLRCFLARRGEGRGGLPPDNRRANEPGDLSIRQSRGLPTPPQWLPKTAVLLTACATLMACLVGCEGSGGVNGGATVDAYVAGALCAEAKEELARHGGEAGGLRIRAICLPRTERGGRLDLAQIGANARRATEDSASIAYIGEPSAAASRFSETILEAARIRQFPAMPGAAAMRELLRELEDGKLG